MFLIKYSTCFGQFHCPLSGVSQHCIHAKYICHANSFGVCQRGHPNHANRRQQNQHDKYNLRVYSVEILLIMDSGTVRNMQSTLSNKYEKQCITLAFVIRILHAHVYCPIYRCPQPVTLKNTEHFIAEHSMVALTNRKPRSAITSRKTYSSIFSRERHFNLLLRLC